MAYRAIDIAHYIIKRCADKGTPISNLKLQKMLYFAWVEYYKRTEVELFMDDICAWKLGPVVPNVYYDFCQYAGLPIPALQEPSVRDTDKKILSSIIDNYSKKSTSSLVNLTHAAGKPWDRIFRGGFGNRSVIPFSLITELECGDY